MKHGQCEGEQERDEEIEKERRGAADREINGVGKKHLRLCIALW